MSDTRKDFRDHYLGRLGPKTNVRPAGAHKDRRVETRGHAKQALRRELRTHGFDY